VDPRKWSNLKEEHQMGYYFALAFSQPRSTDCRREECLMLSAVLEKITPMINYNPFAQVQITTSMTGGEGDLPLLQE
jgi:hypothetical protein